VLVYDTTRQRESLHFVAFWTILLTAFPRQWSFLEIPKAWVLILQKARGGAGVSLCPWVAS
jgi:hypothetical protein